MTQDLKVFQPDTSHMTRKVSLPKMDLRYFQGVESRADLMNRYGEYVDQYHAGVEMDMRAIDREHQQVFEAILAADYPRRPRVLRILARAFAVAATAGVVYQGYPLLTDPQYPLYARLIGAAVVVWALVLAVRKLWNPDRE